MYCTKINKIDYEQFVNGNIFVISCTKRIQMKIYIIYKT